MKKILSILSAAVLSISMLMSMTAYADGEATELIAKKGSVNVDGKIGSGEWSDAASITITPENSTVTIITEGVEVDTTLSVKISVKYDENFIYFLEERTSKYIDTPHTQTLDHLVYRGDSTNIILNMYLPNGTEEEAELNTCDFVFAPDMTDDDPDKLNPIFQFRATTFASSSWGDLAEVYHKIKSTIDTTRTSSVTEVAVSWEKLFQGNSHHESTTKDYKKYIKQFAANEGFAMKFAAVVHEGNSNKEHEYSLAYGCNVLNDPADVFSGTKLLGDDIGSWGFIYLGKKPEGGQVDLASIVEKAKESEKDAEGMETIKTILIWVGIVIVVIAIAVFIVFRIFGIKLNFGSSDDEDEDEDEDEDDEEYDEDEDEEEEE